MDRDSRFRALFNENYSALVRYGRHRGLTADEADDLIANTFEVVWRRIGDVPDGDEAVLWLYGVAFNQLRNLRRSKRRQRRLLQRATSTTTSVALAEPSDISASLIREALEELSVDDREVILLVATEGLSAAEVGTVLGCGETTARSRLHRARARLSLKLSAGEQRIRVTGHVESATEHSTEVQQ